MQPGKSPGRASEGCHVPPRQTGAARLAAPMFGVPGSLAARSGDLQNLAFRRFDQRAVQGDDGRAVRVAVEDELHVHMARPL